MKFTCKPNTCSNTNGAIPGTFFKNEGLICCREWVDNMTAQSGGRALRRCCCLATACDQQGKTCLNLGFSQSQPRTTEPRGRAGQAAGTQSMLFETPIFLSWVGSCSVPAFTKDQSLVTGSFGNWKRGGKGPVLEDAWVRPHEFPQWGKQWLLVTVSGQDYRTGGQPPPLCDPNWVPGTEVPDPSINQSQGWIQEKYMCSYTSERFGRIVFPLFFLLMKVHQGDQDSFSSKTRSKAKLKWSRKFVLIQEALQLHGSSLYACIPLKRALFCLLENNLNLGLILNIFLDNRGGGSCFGSTC